ncbi:interleukin-4 receptor subunit alpha [Pelobates cultripes]|uniref:Interleukin-4 receptor subunit alpha n=1 Tax=Pelobates cultripes TaxID=61616 RepID=A0AAD1SV19_PELCU|nr:interleukin-4 receptor subunit alpha [Pelobates cultripes]
MKIVVNLLAITIPKSMAHITTLFWFLLLWNVHNAHETSIVTNFDCLNDYEEYSYCFWDVMSALKVNCTEDFLLKYENDHTNFSDICIPESQVMADIILPNKCICHLNIEDYFAPVVFSVELVSNETSLKKMDFHLSQKVKPKTPFNVTVKASDLENVFVQWDSGCKEGNFVRDMLIYELQFTSRQDPAEVKTTSSSEGKTCYEIDKRQFKQGHDYMVQVRSKVRPVPIGYNGTWSEWSSEAEWHNEYSLSLTDQLQIFIPTICILIIAIIVACKCAVHFCKKNWLDRIPNVKKSQLAQSKLFTIQKPMMKPDGSCNHLKHEKKKRYGNAIRGNWLYKLIFKVRNEYDYNTNGKTETDCPTYCTVFETNQRILTLENENIETVLEICPLENEKNISESGDDEDGGFPTSELSSSVKNTLLNIINSDSMFERSCEQQNSSSSWDGFSGFGEFWQKEKSHVEQSENCSELGYHRYECDNSAVELKYKASQSQHSGFDQFSGTQQQPKSAVNLVKISLNDRFDVCMNTGYNSFANIVSGTQDQENCVTNPVCNDQTWPLSVPTSTVDRECILLTCLDNAKCYNGNPNLQLTEMSPSTIYYQFTLKSKSQEPLDSNQDKRMDNCVGIYPTSSQECAGYQSFSSAIEQEKASTSFPVGPTDSSVLDSGYKSFECVLTQNKTDIDSCCLYDGDIEFQFGQSENDVELSCDFDLSETRVASNGTKEKIEDADASRLCFGLPNFSFAEAFLGDCNTSKEDNYHQPHKREPTKQKEDDGNISNNTQHNTNINHHDENDGEIPYALTFDLSNHLWNVTNICGHNKTPENLKSESLVHIKMNDNIFSCTNNMKYGYKLEGIEDHLSFTDYLNEPSYQQMKFENMSYFLHPFSLKNTQDNLCETSTKLLMPEKMFDKDGNLYLKLALLNIHPSIGNFDCDVGEL